MKNALKWRVLIILLLVTGAFFLLNNKPLNLGLDLQGGMRLVLEAQDTDKIKVDNDAVIGVLGVIRNRIDSLGISEPLIQRKGKRQVIVELPGIKEPERAIKMIGDTALLEFVSAEWAPGDASLLTDEKIKKLAGDNARIDKVQYFDNAGNVVKEVPIILKDTVMTGAALKNSIPENDQYNRPVVGIEFTSEGTKQFRDVTAANVGRPLAILLDGRIISAPNINEPIPGGKAIISGGFTSAEVRDLVIKLKAGALPVPVEIVENKIIGPTLGKDSIEKSLRAGIYGFIIVALFMLVYYRLPGFMAVIALLIYLVLDLAVLSFLGATLTLPGLAGIVLAIGMAVDANVIIFERLKEELRAGKAVKAAVDAGFSRAFMTIIDANITTIITGLVLFLLGTGTIKGFAVTLCIGILVSMFSAIFVSRVLMELIVDLRLVKSGKLVKG